MNDNTVTCSPNFSISSASFHQPKNALNPLTKQVRDLIKPYEKSRYIPAFQSLFDSTNLWYTSCCNLYFSYRDAYNQSSTVLDPQSFQLSSREFHDFEHTPEGFATTLGLGLTLVSFCFIGSISDKDDEKSHWILRWMNFLLPYIRIFLKQIKWVFKGIRFVLSTLVQFGCHKETLIHLLFPIAAVMAIASVANRIWLRRMQDTRKKLQRDNIKLSEDILLSKTLVHELDVLPGSCDLGAFKRSFIFVLGQDNDEKRDLFYINESGDAEPVSGADALYKGLCDIRVNNIHGIMQHHLAFLLKNKGNSEDVKLSLYKGEANDLTSRYRPGSYVYITNESMDSNNRLCYITENGVLNFDNNNSAKFHQTYQKVVKQQTLAVIPLEELLIMPEIIEFQTKRFQQEPSLPAFKLGTRYQNYVTFTEYRNEQTIQALDPWDAKTAFFSAAMGGFADGLYFYMGTVTLAAFTPQAYMILLVISIALLIACMIVRVYEETVFQRRHKLTCIQPELELSRTACKLLFSKLDALLENSGQVPEQELKDLIDCLRKRASERVSSEVETDTDQQQDYTEETAKQLLMHELWHEAKIAIGLRDQQKHEVKGTPEMAVLGGLFNGLALQGVIASFMFVMATFFYGTLGCPPLFIIGCLVAGIIAIITSCVQAQQQYRTFRLAFDEEEKSFDDEYKSACDAQRASKYNGPPQPADQKLHEILKDTLDYIDSTSFEPPLDYMVVEWCEVGRLFLAGLNKGDKASFELFYNFLKKYDELWFMPVVVFISAICFATAFVLQYIAKTFAPTPPNYIEVRQGKQILKCEYDDKASLFNAPSPLTQISFLRNLNRDASNNTLGEEGYDPCLGVGDDLEIKHVPN